VVELFEQARKISPKYPGVYYEYARAHLKMNGDDGKKAALHNRVTISSRVRISMAMAPLLNKENTAFRGCHWLWFSGQPKKCQFPGPGQVAMMLADWICFTP